MLSIPTLSALALMALLANALLARATLGGGRLLMGLRDREAFDGRRRPSAGRQLDRELQA